ncbi:MAG: AsmA-like C-terminal region-containing protein [Gammaproteobacteria bacterium]
MVLRSGWLRTTIIVGIVVASFVSALAVAYELALSRVPRQRAAFESLVRAQTGLDIRFNELSLRWGWYGPEAVFRRVELGEPGRSSVLLRAPQLIIGINAWQTARSGQLVAGRITLVAPDIDLERLARAPASGTPVLDSSSAADVARESRARVLRRWKGGVVDLQGGTLKLPDPGGGGGALTLQIRRAALKRAGDEWSGHALVFLPDRLGRTARVVFQLNGDINSPASLDGGVRFEGVRLSFSSWRGVLARLPRLAANLPQGGSGDVTFDLTLKQGRVEKADGQVRAVDLVLGTPSWLEPVQASRSALKLDYVSGDWRFLRRGETSQLQVGQLVLGREQKASPLSQFTVEMGPAHVHSSLDSAPFSSVATLARWLAPELVPAGVTLDGDVQAIDVDWNAARPEGFRLAASAHVGEATASSVSRGFTLKDLPVRLHATENRVELEVDAHAAQLQLSADPEQPLNALRLVSRISVSREGSGWRVAIPRLEYQDESIRGEISGTLAAGMADGEPLLDLRGTVAHADIVKLQERFADLVARAFGPAGMRVGAGRIENGAFELRGRLDALESSRFVGSFNLRGARIPSDGAWPDADAIDANVEWSGARIGAMITDGHAGSFDLQSVKAQWDATGAAPTRFTGRVHGRLEEALDWMRAHPELQKQAPHLQELLASGDALFDFDVTLPGAGAGAGVGAGAGAGAASHSGLVARAGGGAGSAAEPASPLARARISAALEGVQFRLAPDLPPVESVRGVLAYDSGHLQRSTLSATWLGGPLTLKIGERRDRKGSPLVVQAQGFVDARKLVALSQIRHLAEVSGETSWNGEFAYIPPDDTAPARWQGRADSTLVGVASELPAPLAKAAGTVLPLHIEITGTGDASELRANLADRLRAAFALNVVNREDWHVDRGAIRLGGGAATLPAEDIIQIRGHVKRIDAPAYVLAWQQLRKAAPDTHADIDISADELAFGDRVYDDASVQASAASTGAHPDATALRIEADTLGVLSGTLMPDLGDVVFTNLSLKKQFLAGTGSLRCAADLASCRGEFELDSSDTAATLADLGFRADLSAARGSLSGEIAWQPRLEGPWVQSATGTLSMRFEDGVARRPDDTVGRPFALLTVPALLNGIARHTATSGVAVQDAAGEPGELKFKRLEAHFQLRDGQATTSDLHFDGDAEILARGRTGLLTGDYDHEAWVLRGEDRLPASMRRLASAPRVAAAWLTLRELIGRDATSRSRIVLRLRGSWNEPVVTVE